jgi:nucleotide-binding universal stress UspA family protein
MTTMIVGCAPDRPGTGALGLAALLARSAGDDLVVASVVPTPWVPGVKRFDAEYRADLDRSADQTLEEARRRLPDDVSATFVRHGARSVPAGLLELADRHAAELVVLGSSSAGVFGHVALGSVTDRLVHSSPVSLGLATRGFRAAPGARARRLTVAYGGQSSHEELVVAAATLAARVGVPMRIASFAVWSRPPITARTGGDYGHRVLEQWAEDVGATTDKALAQVEELASAPREVETVVGRGSSWADALEDVRWAEGDLLVVGSSALGPVAQVFLGSRATKIVRHSPVPVLVLPRTRTERLAGEAARA